MMNRLSTDPYKGTRDFYPEDMAVLRYICDTWSKTAERFGYERYDASILEPAELYKNKGAENAEMVNEQTYTFTDRGDREVTLRPEMTPTVARMIAARARTLSFPVRWYAIPNLFRYERPQRGRLREHWQLNCDLFGITDSAADIEVIELAYHVLSDFGATPDMFGIKINSRAALNAFFKDAGITDSETIRNVTSVIDRKAKVSAAEFEKMLSEAAGMTLTLPTDTPTDVQVVIDGLRELGITNAVYDPSVVRGFNYYTGVVFEVFDTAADNNRSLIGGGRYDNLTEMFGGTPVSGIGFGMGDVTMRDFLETHKLMPDTAHKTSARVIVLPTHPALNRAALHTAQQFRAHGIRTSVDLSDRKIGKKIGTASDRGAAFILVVGEDEIKTGTFTLKELASGTERTGSPLDLARNIA
jgi:histidyl-tRNA synthetase